MDPVLTGTYAVAKRYVTAAEVAEVEAVLDRVRAMLYRLTQR
jgi:hypothetical protein